MTARDGDEAGFTLLDVLITLVIMGFVLAALAQGMRFGLTAWDRQQMEIDRRAGFDAAERTLRRLIEGMEPAGPTRPASILGDSQRLSFTAELPQAAAVAADRHADMQLLVDGGRRLVLRWTPNRPPARLSPPPPPETVALLDDVDRVEFAYWPRTGGGGWQGGWKSGEPPALVRLRIRQAGGTGPGWPDLVIAPRRDRPDG